MEDYAVRQQAQTAALYVSQFAAPRLVPGDFLSPPPARRVQFEFALHDLVGRASIVRVAVWNKDGHVLYSNDRTLMGRTSPLSPLLDLALDGRIQWQLVRPDVGSPAVRRVEVFVPVVVNGAARPVAAYDVLFDLPGLEPALISLKWSVRGTVALGILALYVGLFTIVRSASRDLERQNMALRIAFDGTIRSLVNAVDARDMATADHSSRVTEYAISIARAMRVNKTQVEEIQVAGFLHDLGKIGIRDDILTKPGPLTKQERRMMQRHPLLGYEILQPVPIAERIKLAIRHSHEHWDGNGYPDGLSGEQIPLAARVIAVADAYEALTTGRPYRPAGDPADAVEEIKRYAGTQFDPTVVDAFLRVCLQWADSTRSSARSVPQSATTGTR